MFLCYWNAIWTKFDVLAQYKQWLIWGGIVRKELIEKHGYQILSFAGLALAGLGQILKDKAGNMELEKLVEQKVKEKLG